MWAEGHIQARMEDLLIEETKDNRKKHKEEEEERRVFGLIYQDKRRLI